MKGDICHRNPERHSTSCTIHGWLSVASASQRIIMSSLRQDRFTGCLLGVAVGDAMGQPIEAFPPERLQREFGEIRDFMPGDPRLPLPLGPGQWTDDTQMTLDVLKSIIRQGKVDPEDIAREFLQDHEQEGIRFSGFTIKYSLLRLKNGASWMESGLGDEQTQANGAAMRVAPIGLFDALHLDRLPGDVRVASIITHKHPEAVVGALAVAYMMARAAANTLNPESILHETLEFIGPSKVADNLRLAGQCLKDGTPVETAMKKLGTTGYIVHTAAAAVYCFLQSPDDLERTVINAVMGGNDADTIASIAGGISGAYNGEGAIPTRWRDGVERGDEIESMARDLYRLTAQA
jgi:ADP-ribosyl-[dinitrogen reductase] hydrolase